MQTSFPSKIWRMQNDKYKLVGIKCENCQKISYPVKKLCSFCHSKSVYRHNLSTYGKIVSWSLIYSAPVGFSELVPYPIVLIKLEDGVTVLSQLTDYDKSKVKIGLRVEAVFRKQFRAGDADVINYGIKFRPRDWPSQTR